MVFQVEGNPAEHGPRYRFKRKRVRVAPISNASGAIQLRLMPPSLVQGWEVTSYLAVLTIKYSNKMCARREQNT
jgi:hypothetical protein